MIENGNVHLPKEAHWKDDFLLEILALPHGEHDDTDRSHYAGTDLDEGRRRATLCRDLSCADLLIERVDQIERGDGDSQTSLHAESLGAFVPISVASLVRPLARTAGTCYSPPHDRCVCFAVGGRERVECMGGRSRSGLKRPTRMGRARYGRSHDDALPAATDRR